MIRKWPDQSESPTTKNVQRGANSKQINAKKNTKQIKQQRKQCLGTVNDKSTMA